MIHIVLGLPSKFWTNLVLMADRHSYAEETDEDLSRSTASWPVKLQRYSQKYSQLMCSECLSDVILMYSQFLFVCFPYAFLCALTNTPNHFQTRSWCISGTGIPNALENTKATAHEWIEVLGSRTSWIRGESANLSKTPCARVPQELSHCVGEQVWRNVNFCQRRMILQQQLESDNGRSMCVCVCVCVSDGKSDELKSSITNRNHAHWTSMAVPTLPFEIKPSFQCQCALLRRVFVGASASPDPSAEVPVLTFWQETPCACDAQHTWRNRTRLLQHLFFTMCVQGALGLHVSKLVFVFSAWCHLWQIFGWPGFEVQGLNPGLDIGFDVYAEP